MTRRRVRNLLAAAPDLSVEVVSCPECAALVTVADTEDHDGWHRDRARLADLVERQARLLDALGYHIVID